MCGIIGYTGHSHAFPVLVQGIRLLSYRGYDSAGVCIGHNGSLQIQKDKGRIADLAPLWSQLELEGSTGIGHTRWATHGEPTRRNAHPQADASSQVAVVHNGILENDLTLRDELTTAGVSFGSDTDTEVFVHLFARAFDGDPVAAARVLLQRCKGAFSLAIQHHALGDKLVAVRRGSPLLIGIGVGENLISSDLRALAGRADFVVELGEDQIATVTPDEVKLFDADGKSVAFEQRPLKDTDYETGKDGYPHFMLKEIYEQPERLYELIGSRVHLQDDSVLLGEIAFSDEEWRTIERVDFVGCGTAFHACLFGAYAFEAIAGLPARAIMAHEYDARDPQLNENVLVVAVSQSGETADTRVAIELAVERGARTLAILNMRESVIGRTVEAVLDMHAGLEIGVASTKAYTAMVCAALILSMRAAQARGSTDPLLLELGRGLHGVPDAIREVLASSAEVGEIAREIHRASNMLYLGRGADAATALEGALKMKEISYIHAEGYPAGEMKHGPIALVSWEVPTVAIATDGPWRNRMMGNVREVRAREGMVILVASEGDEDAAKIADHVLTVPRMHPWLAAIVNAVPLQLLAYETAKRRGCDIDQPRNLAKTVTVQ